MKLEIFETTMCCSTGICGPSVDEKLIKISENIEILKKNFEGLEVARYQPQTHGLKFVTNKEVSKLMKEKGNKILPITVFDKKIIKYGAYPSLEELQEAVSGQNN
jgi:hypothetical protein